MFETLRGHRSATQHK